MEILEPRIRSYSTSTQIFSPSKLKSICKLRNTFCGPHHSSKITKWLDDLTWSSVFTCSRLYGHKVTLLQKLQLDSPEDAEYIVAKAIRDNVIDATINHEKGYVIVITELSVRPTVHV